MVSSTITKKSWVTRKNNKMGNALQIVLFVIVITYPIYDLFFGEIKEVLLSLKSFLIKFRQ